MPECGASVNIPTRGTLVRDAGGKKRSAARATQIATVPIHRLLFPRRTIRKCCTEGGARAMALREQSVQDPLAVVDAVAVIAIDPRGSALRRVRNEVIAAHVGAVPPFSRPAPESHVRFEPRDERRWEFACCRLAGDRRSKRLNRRRRVTALGVRRATAAHGRSPTTESDRRDRRWSHLNLMGRTTSDYQ